MFGKAAAQSALGTADNPQFWMLSPPPGWTGLPNDPDDSEQDRWVFQPHMLPMIDVNKRGLAAPQNAAAAFNVALATYGDYLDYIEETNEDGLEYFTDHIGVVKYNFGDSATTNFFRVPPAASIPTQKDVDPDYEPGNNGRASQCHPFLTGHVTNAGQYMSTFCGLWRIAEQEQLIKAPKFFYFDTEKLPMPFGTADFVNATRLFESYSDSTRSVDNRATTVNLPFPAVGSSSLNRPFASWLDEAENVFEGIDLKPSVILNTWRDDYPTNGILGFTRTLELNDHPNYSRRVWYERFWPLDVDGALARAGYDIVGSTANGGWDGCESAAYHFFRLPIAEGLAPILSAPQTADELSDMTDHFGFGSASTPFTYQWSFDSGIWTNTMNGGYPAAAAGGRPTNVGFIGDFSTGDTGSSATYFCTGRHGHFPTNYASGSHDSPRLYGIKVQYDESNGNQAFPDHRRPNLYVPPATWTTPQNPAGCYTLFEAEPGPWTGNEVDNACRRDDHYIADLPVPGSLVVTCNAREETYEEASERISRYPIESILNSGAGTVERFRPTIPMIGSQVVGDFAHGPDVFAGEDLVRRIMGLIRHKGAASAVVYDDRIGVIGENGAWPSPADWATFERVRDEVYNLKLTDFEVINGMYNATGDELNALSRTLLDAGAPYSLDIDSEFSGGQHISGLLLELTGDLLAPGADGTIRLTLEGETNRPLTSWPPPNCGDEGSPPNYEHMKDIRGKVYAFNWDTESWDQLVVPDFTDGSYGLFAPLEHARPYDEACDCVFRTMRRTYQFSVEELDGVYVKTEQTGGGPRTS